MSAFDTAWDLLKMPYHGTNNEAAKKIMIEGLKPHFNENSARMGIPEVVFATDNYEEALAHAEDDTYGTDLNPVVIHISDEVKPADDSYAPWYLYDKIIPPDKLRIMQKSFEKAWSELLGRNVEDDAMPSWNAEENTMDALRGDIEIEGGNYYGTTTELRSGSVVEESRRYDTWEQAEAWVRERLNNYNDNRGSIVNGGIQEHPFSGKRYQDYWNNADEIYIGTVWERD